MESTKSRHSEKFSFHSPESPATRVMVKSKRRIPDIRGSSSYPRRRAFTACLVCRARKTRCDNKKPRCSFCESVGATCVSEPQTNLATLDQASLAILDRIDRLEETILSKGPSVESQSYSRLSPVPDDRENFLHGRSSTTTVEEILSWPVFQGQYEQPPSLKVLLGQQPTRTSTPNFPGLGDLSLSISDFEPDLCNRLLDNFFRYVHSKNPILDEYEVRQWALDMCFRGVGWNARSCLVLLISALGSISFPLGPVIDRPTANSTVGCQDKDYTFAESLFTASQQRLGPLMVTAGVLETQCMFYSGVYLMHTMRPFEAWRYFVQALACSQIFDFSADCTQAVQPPGIAEYQPHSPQSIYWTCLKSELELRLELSVPGYGASDLSYPPFLPTPPLASLPQQNRPWYFYLAEIALRRLANQVLQRLLLHREGNTYAKLDRLKYWTSIFESQAKEWAELLPPEIDFEKLGEDNDILSFILMGHLLSCYDIMYLPYVSKQINNVERDHSIDEYAMKGLQVCVDRIHKNESGFFHRHHGTWLLLRCCTRSALILIAAKLRGNMNDLMPHDWEAAVRRVVVVLEFWADESPDTKNRHDILRELLGRLQNDQS